MTGNPGVEPSRFPDFDVLGQRKMWDRVTSGVVLARLAPPPAPRFFSAAEEPTIRTLLDRILGQNNEPRIPIFEMIDARLQDGAGDGYRYETMPEDRDAWRRSAAGLDDDSRPTRFHLLDRRAQMDIIENVQVTDGDWHGMPAARVFDLWMRYACTAFYSHPWAWNEIGFGGPAYPRGYANLGVDRREPWERPERHPADPIPWAERATAVKKAHAARDPQ